jgi:hypothetical protein
LKNEIGKKGQDTNRKYLRNETKRIENKITGLEKRNGKNSQTKRNEKKKSRVSKRNEKKKSEKRKKNKHFSNPGKKSWFVQKVDRCFFLKSRIRIRIPFLKKILDIRIPITHTEIVFDHRLLFFKIFE